MDPIHLRKNQYLLQFNTKEKKRLALERAWKNRDFEIELYWKRATYFWAFLVSAFAGYFLILSRKDALDQFPAAAVLLSSIGLIFSHAWFRVNLGSKKWQVNWEKHIDMLENDVTGPIYKTVLRRTGWSVSGINLEVSRFIRVIWVLILIYSIIELVIRQTCASTHEIILNSTVVLLIMILTIKFFRRINRSKRPSDEDETAISFELRSNNYKNPL